MKSKSLIILVSVLILASLIVNYFFLYTPQIEEFPDFFVGVDVAYADLDAIKRVIDEVSSYTNLFVIGSTGISSDKIKLDETCQYLYDKDMYFIIYHHDHFRLQLTSDIEKKFGDHFLGVYFDDEQAGKQLDTFELRWVNEADNYTDASNQFVEHLKWWLNLRSYGNVTFPYAPSDFRLFTSDYALYWFDYNAGYDVVFGEFGWNYSRQLNLALNRGAATVQNKDWGTIITWTYNQPPYIESGEELYDDLILAYNNGAKYILVFDTNKNYTESILEEEHFEALEEFWQYTQDNPRNNIQLEKRVAFVLPKDFGYGFRGPDDKIWGLWDWDADNNSLEISYHLGSLLEEYGTKLDIIYDDDVKFNQVYSKYIFWNGATISDS